MELPPVVSASEWDAAREQLLAMEKDLTRARDALAAERRRQPMVAFDADYRFAGTDGEARLLDLFEGRSQLIVYHFMFEAGGGPCKGCSFFVDQVGHLAHLHARDTSFALTSRAPQTEIDAFERRMGWSIPWYTVVDEEFNQAAGIRTGFGLSVFLRDGHSVFRSYFTGSRGVEALGSAWTFLDLTPLGRQETWEDSPAGSPQGPPYQWWRLHDEYDADGAPSTAPAAAADREASQ